jgi:protein tyrosine/serine phosphatase
MSANRAALFWWLTTVEIDLDGLENEAFWKDYWDNGLVGTALYFRAHLDAMPERSIAALSAIVSARPGGVLFHCMGGRDRTGIVALLLLTAADTEIEEIVDDYIETVRLGDLRAAASKRSNAEPELEAICQRHGTTTERAFRNAARWINLEQILVAGGMGRDEREALMSWRGHLC